MTESNYRTTTMPSQTTHRQNRQAVVRLPRKWRETSARWASKFSHTYMGHRTQAGASVCCTTRHQRAKVEKKSKDARTYHSDNALAKLLVVSVHAAVPQQEKSNTVNLSRFLLLQPSTASFPTSHIATWGPCTSALGYFQTCTTRQRRSAFFRFIKWIAIRTD